MYNTVTSVGYLVADPEVRHTKTGKTITKLRVGISPSRAKEKCFIDVEFWEKPAEIAAEYLKKGREFLFTGELAADSWEDKNGGGKRTKLYIRGKELQFLNSGKKDDDQNSGGNSSQSSNNSDDDDEIPF